MRPRLVALADRTADVVEVAGGWLCDQVLAGWDVTVVTADHADQRALRILGVRGQDLESALAAPVQGPCLRAIAVQAELYGAHERVRRLVRDAADGARTEIRLWGDTWPEDFGTRADQVSHRLSAAARAFKAEALAAAAAGPQASDALAFETRASQTRACQTRAADTEEFRRAALRRLALV